MKGTGFVAKFVELEGNVTKERPPTAEEAAAGVKRVIEGFEVTGVSLVPKCPYCGGRGYPGDCDVCQMNRRAREGR